MNITEERINKVTPGVNWAFLTLGKSETFKVISKPQNIVINTIRVIVNILLLGVLFQQF